MRKLKLLLALSALIVGAGGLQAQTDVTSTYLTNADFSQTTALDNGLCGYGKDMSGKGTTYYGLQAIDGWTSVVVSGDNSNNTYPNSGMGGAVFAYGSDYLMMGNNTKAPSADPDGNSGKCLGFFGVWGCGGYYYQEVTLAAGKYTINIPVYNQSGTQANTSYIGWIPNSGTSYTLATNPTVGSWTTLTTTFTLTDATTGKICLGYKSTGSGSGANAMLYFDKVQILYTAIVVKDVLETALTAATNANTTLKSSDLAAAIATAQAVYDDENATQDEVNSAAVVLNNATELAMSAAGDVTGIFLSNPGFESSTVTTTNAAAGGSAAPVDIAGGWTQVGSASWSSSAVVSYGGSGQVNGVSAPSADNAGNSGNTLGVSVGWGGTVTYKTASVTLPAGVYTLQVYGYNATSVTPFKSLFGFVPSAGTSSLSSKTSFAATTWETDKVTFNLNNATEGYFQIGGTTQASGGSGNNGKVFFDNITITYKSFLAGAKEAWDEAVEDATAAKTECPNVTGEELTALNTELDKTEPTTVDGYNEATEAIEAATATLRAAATSYNALAVINAMITSVGTLQYADPEKKPSASVTATSASDADTKTASQITALRAYYESHALAEAVDGAVNVTNSIANANNPTNNNGWTWTGSKNNPASNEPWTDADGTNSHSYFDGGNWGGSSWTTTMSQDITLPAGTYLLTAKGRAATNTTLTLSVGDDEVGLPHIGNAGNVFDRGWGDASLEFTTDGRGFTILVTATAEPTHEWFSISDFRLVRLSLNTDAYADGDDYDALNSAISAAEAKTLGFEDGEYAPYNNVAALEALAAAKAIDQDAELTNFKEDVQAATAALTGATWTANPGNVDIIYNGMFATVAEGQNYPDGWTRTNGWGQMLSKIEGDFATAYYNQPGSLQYGNQGVYTMPLNENEWYQLTFSYRSHENNSNGGVAASVLNAEDGLAAVNFTANGSTTEWKTVTAFFKTGAAGNYVLTLANSGNTWITNVGLTSYGVLYSQEGDFDEDCGIWEDYLPYSEIFFSSLTLTRSFTGAYNWSTLVVPFDITNEELVDAFGVDVAVAEFSEESADANDITVNFNMMTTPAVTANKPVLVRSKASVSEIELTNKLVILRGEANAKVEGTNIDFQGIYDYTDPDDCENPFTIPEGDYFISGNKLYKSAGATTIKPFRAYLKCKSADARIANFNIGDDETTGIADVRGKMEDGRSDIYNLNGQRVEKAKKGLYIQNGKKVVIK